MVLLSCRPMRGHELLKADRTVDVQMTDAYLALRSVQQEAHQRLCRWSTCPLLGRARDHGRSTTSVAVLTSVQVISQIITRQSDGMSGVAGDFDDTDSDADSDSHIDLEELQPMNELSFSQVCSLCLVTCCSVHCSWKLH